MTFRDRLGAAVARNDSLLCVGLDPEPRRIPARFGSGADAVVPFNRAIIEATSDLVCAYKPNLGFYLQYGAAGVDALIETRRMVPADIPVLLDCKVGDLGNTAEAYARAYYDSWQFDAVTAQPYLGFDSLEPFLRYRDRAVFVLTHTSNPSSADLQDLPLACAESEPVYRRVARQAQSWQERYGSAALVVGATWPEQLANARALCPELPILVPGIGAQGGDLEASVTAGATPQGDLLISASRAVLYAAQGDEDAVHAARRVASELREQIQRAWVRD